jgi:adenosine deaminase
LRTPAPLDDFIRRIPKAELHMHVEGSLEPELAFELAARNGVRLRYPSVEALRRAYEFEDLQSISTTTGPVSCAPAGTFSS